MLTQFRFQNFRSFRDESILDLTATGISEHPDHIIRLEDEEVLPIAVIYGANASGKTNVIKAFRFMKEYVLNSFTYGGEALDYGGVRRAMPIPFLFDDTSGDEVSLFEARFIKEEEDGYKSYNYGFTVSQEGVEEEWLHVKRGNKGEYRTVIYRDKGETDLSGLSDREIAERLIIPSLYDEVLVVSLGAKLKIPELKTVWDCFWECKLFVYGDPIENVFLSSRIPNGFADDKSVQEKIAKYVAAFDPSIMGFQVEDVEGSGEDGPYGKVMINALHKAANYNQLASLPLQEESDGTLKMISIYPVLQYVLKHGGVLFVDELNARLHPLLVRLIIVLFLDEETNPRHAQLICSLHDAWQLSNQLLRMDEVWITDKDVSTGASCLYSLSDFEDEGEMAWNKTICEEDYLVGKYGGIPNPSKFDVFKEDYSKRQI